MKLKIITCLFFLLGLTNLLIAQSDAGIIVSPVKTAKITASSGTNIEYIRDGNTETYWESTNALPDNYLDSDELNLFLKEENFEVVGEANKYLLAFDGNTNTKSDIDKGLTVIKMYNNKPLKYLSVKLSTNTEVAIEIIFETGIVDRHLINSGMSYLLQFFEVNETSIVKEIHLRSSEKFQLFELAAIDNEVVDKIDFDFSSPIEIGVIMSRHLNSEGVDSIQILYSNNKRDWNKITNLNPKAVAYVSLKLEPLIYARYLRINIFSKPKPYFKASFREFAVYDRYGLFGKPDDAVPSENIWSQSFGVNTIWGWGYGVSSKQIGNKAGAAKFNKVTSLARSYHRLDWDISNPGDTPEFIMREKSVDSLKNEWLDWKEEYKIWKNFSIETDACILFNNDYFPESKWTNAFFQAKKYGEEFSRFFEKNDIVSMLEVGNEPWGYSKSLYAEILKGMTTGIKNTSNKIKVLPCGLQAYDKHLYLNNYISDYILPNNNIDGLNTHIYSYIINENGERVAINPEDPRSETWSVNNLKKWALANNYAPDIYVTEFGYDSDGGGDDCIHSNCISEFEQAIYGLRQALIFYRLGVKEFYWYYFANVDWNSILHNRSGLLSNYSSGFHEKMSFKVFENVYTELKDYSFNAVVEESNEVYCYEFKNSANNKRLFIAWRPTSENHKESLWVDIPLKENILQVVKLTKTEESISYKKEVNKLRIALSGEPVIIKLSKN